MEIKICVVNANDFRIGHWFTLPTPIAKINTEVFGNREIGEYLITDFEAPFDINEQENISRLNKIAEMFKEHSENAVLDHTKEILKLEIYTSPEEMLKNIDKIRFIKGDLFDLGETIFGERYKIDEKIKPYIDYERFGRNLFHDEKILEVHFGYIQIL